MNFIFETACIYSTGKLRRQNEDNLYYDRMILEKNYSATENYWHKQLMQESACFGIFDGMGGMQDGQIASYIAAKSFSKDCKAIENGGLMSEIFFINAVLHMNDAVVAEKNRCDSNMGTTAVLLGFCDNYVYLCNVGDSRAYRYRDNTLTQISIDHVLPTPPYMMDGKHGKPGLSQCIGISTDEMLLEPHLVHGTIQSGDIYLICSDGLTDMVSDFEISGVLGSGRDVGVCVKKLCDLAIGNGGRDNITLILVQTITSKERG